MREGFFVICQTCFERHEFQVDPEDYYAFRNGTFVQDAFPYLTTDQRELMVSQTCGPCFDKMFPEADDYELPEEFSDEFTPEEWKDLVISLEQMMSKDLRTVHFGDDKEDDI